MRLNRLYRAVALSLALGTTLASTGVLAEQIGMLPVNYSMIKTSINDGNDFTMQETGSDLQWKFGSGDTSLYRLLGQLNAVGAANIAQFAYVGNAPGTDPVNHGAWIAPLSSSNQPSVYPGGVPAGAKSFNAQSLTVQPGDEKHGPTLTDGSVIVAMSPKGEDDASLQLLKQMLQTYGLNTAWQIPTEAERDITPVGNLGPVMVFLKIDADTMQKANAACAHRWSSVSCMLHGLAASR